MKKIICIIAVTLSIIGVSYAVDTFVMDTATVREEALNQAHQKIKNYFELFDIDGNGKLSVSECAGSGEGYENIPFFSKEEISEIKNKIDSAFSRFDKDADGYLDKDESQAYFTYIENIALDKQMAKMDPDGDGNISEEEMSQIMKNAPSIEESMAKLEEATKKLQEANPEQIADQTLNNASSATAKEEAIQMDANKDNKITKEEYTKYMFNHPDNKDLKLSEDDYNEIFDMIDKHQTGYITHKEYIVYQNSQLQKSLADIEAEDEELDQKEKEKENQKKDDEEKEEDESDMEDVPSEVSDSPEDQTSPSSEPTETK